MYLARKVTSIMKYGERWVISDEKKAEYINKLLPQLTTLRARVGISQDELAGLIGISRQTYCLTESGSHTMSWNTFLSIIMFYDCNSRTHDLLRSTGAFPDDLFYQFNLGLIDRDKAVHAAAGSEAEEMVEALDEAGKRALKLTLIAEYARCKNLSTNDIIHLINDTITK